MVRNALILPAYDASLPDVSRLFNPITQGLNTYREGMDRQFAGQLQRDQFGLQKRQVDGAEAQRGIDNQFRREQFTAQRGDADRNYGLQRDQFGLQKGQADDAKRQRLEAAAAGYAQLVQSEADPTVAAQNWQRFVGAHPEMPRLLKQYGVDPADYKRGAQAVIANVRGYVAPEKTPTQKLQGDEALFRENPTTRLWEKVAGAEPGQGGIKTAKDRIGIEADLRKEYAGLAKPYFETRDAYSRIEQSAKAPSPASDISLIFNYMKMLDPGSVVREGEFATAQNAASIPERIAAQYNRAVAGERLTEAIRADFVNQARGLYGQAQRQYRNIQDQYSAMAIRAGVDPRNTIVDFGRPPEAGDATQRQQFHNPTTGETIEWDGSRWVKAN